MSPNERYEQEYLENKITWYKQELEKPEVTASKAVTHFYTAMLEQTERELAKLNLEQ